MGIGLGIKGVVSAGEECGAGGRVGMGEERRETHGGVSKGREYEPGRGEVGGVKCARM